MRQLLLLLMALICVAYSYGSPISDPPEAPGAWMSIDGKGRIDDPIRFAVIFVAFPNTASGNDTIGFSIEAMLSGVENSIAEQSRNACVIEVEIIRDPRNINAMWRARHDSGKYNTLAEVQAFPPQYAECWYSPTYYNSELQCEILGQIQEQLDSPLSGFDAVLFIYIPGEMSDGSEGNPIQDTGGVAGQGYTHVDMACSVLENVLEGAPSVVAGTQNHLYGMTVNWWNTADPTDVSFEIHHEWGHKLPIGHPSGSTTGIDVPYQCYFGGYDGMRAIWLPQEPYPFFNHPELQYCGWATPILVENNLIDQTLLDCRRSGQMYRVPVSSHQYTVLPQPLTRKIHEL